MCLQFVERYKEIFKEDFGYLVVQVIRRKINIKI